MRLTTDFWVSALIRRVFGAGGFAAVVRRGAAEAGAVFIVHRTRLGETSLYMPAAQTSYEAGRPDERRFALADGVTDADGIDARLEREERFDPDLWVVEIEDWTGPLSELFPIARP